MEPKTYTLKSVEQAHAFFRGYKPHPPTGWWFRGQADATWGLVPKAGREPYLLSGGRHIGRFRAWSKVAVAHEQNLPHNDWERLAMAQHFGLATCLLDWTYNPLAALYFCCSELPEAAGAVFCYDPDAFVDFESVPLNEDLQCCGAGYIPRSISSRILNQRAVFSVHAPANQAIEIKPHYYLGDHPNLVKLVVPAALKGDLLEMLDTYGINASTLFPDLLGLSAHINWETTKIS